MFIIKVDNKLLIQDCSNHKILYKFLFNNNVLLYHLIFLSQKKLIKKLLCTFNQKMKLEI